MESSPPSLIKEEQNPVNEQHKPEEVGLIQALYSPRVVFWMLTVLYKIGHVVIMISSRDLIEPVTTVKNNSSWNKHGCNLISYLKTGDILEEFLTSMTVKLIAFLPLSGNFRITSFRMVLASAVVLALFYSVGLALYLFLKSIISAPFLFLASAIPETAVTSIIPSYKNKMQMEKNTSRALCFKSGVKYKQLSVDVSPIQALSRHDKKNSISAWFSGIIQAGLIGSLLYIGLTFFISGTIVFTLLLSIAVSTRLILWVHHEKTGKRIENEDKDTISNENFIQTLKALPWSLELLFAFTLVDSLEYLFNFGLIELILFDNERLSYHHQYKLLLIVYHAAVNVFYPLSHLVKITKIWILIVLQVINLLLFITRAVYSYMQSIYLLFFLIFYIGALTGLIYGNAQLKIIESVPTSKVELVMKLTSMSNLTGMIIGFVIPRVISFLIC